MWSATSTATFSSAGIGVRKCCTTARCPELDTGRNSVSPWTTPRRHASRTDSVDWIAITPPPLPGLRLLHLHHEGEDHRAAVQTLEVAAEGPVNLLLHLDRIGPGLGVDGGEGVEHGPPGSLEHLGARPLAHDAARHEVGPRDDLARLL